MEHQHEVSEQFLVLARFAPLTNHRVILMLSSTSCMKLQLFLLYRSLTAVPKPGADLAFFNQALGRRKVCFGLVYVFQEQVVLLT